LSTGVTPFLLEPDSAAVLAGQRPFRVYGPGERRWPHVFLMMLVGTALFFGAPYIDQLRKGVTPEAPPPGFYVCPAAFLFFIVAITIQIAAGFRARARLVEQRTYLRGRVVKAQGFRARGGGWALAIDYEFAAPDGARIKGSATAMRPDLDGQPGPEAGTPLLVAYRDRRTFALM
jgi:hypothetical protein